MDAIVSQLIAKRNKLGMSVPKLAEMIDIPADRIYKWEQDKGNPKGNDIDKVKSWLEQLPINSTNGGKDLEQAIKNLTEADLINARNIERLINLLEVKLLGEGKSQFPAPGTSGTETLTSNKKERVK